MMTNAGEIIGKWEHLLTVGWSISQCTTMEISVEVSQKAINSTTIQVSSTAPGHTQKTSLPTIYSCTACTQRTSPPL